MFRNGVNKGSPRKMEAKNPPANTTIIVDNQQAIGCLRENGTDPWIYITIKKLTFSIITICLHYKENQYSVYAWDSVGQ